MKTDQNSSFKRPHRARHAQSAVRAATIEALEPRRLLASIVVNSTADTTANDGVTTLREAITTANSTTASDVITFNLGSGSQTINLGSALPRLTKPVEINGPGASLLTLRRSGSSNYRIFRTASDVVLSGMTMSNARVNDVLGWAGGAVYNETKLTVNDCVISGNADIAGYGGGGVFNVGTVTMNRCTIRDNTSISWGGGILNQGAMTLNQCTIRDNSAYEGGGIYNVLDAGSAVINQCTFSGNHAIDIDTTSDNEGGALYNAGTASITSCTFEDNTAVTSGGAIYNLATASITGSTFEDNAADYAGGAIYQSSQTRMTVTNSTFTRNGADWGAAIVNDRYATLNGCTIVGNTGHGKGLAGGVTTLLNNIIAQNEGGDLSGDVAVSNASATKPWGDNFIGTLAYYDDYGPNPMLGPLADNGGPTQTMAPLPGSPVIDAGNNTYATSEDQRGVGFSRISGSKVDYGAYEAQSVTVDNTGDQSDGNLSSQNVTLREAIEQVNANPRIDIIRFADDVFSTAKTIDTAGLAVTGELDIRGPSAKLLSIRGPLGQADIFDTSTNLYLADLTIQNRGQGAAIDNHNMVSLRRVVVSGTGSSGPGVVTSGTSTVKYSTLMDNAGGGIINLSGSVYAYDCTLSQNSTAIRNDSGSLALTLVTISGNSGEGVRNAGTLTARHTIIATNAAGDVVNTNGGTADLSYFDFIGTRDGDPMLMPLADNGGSTPTMALRPYSPCINKGATGSSTVLDQRGTPRARILDIGAYEYTGPFNNSLVVNTTTDEDNGSADPAYGSGTSLREALLYARDNPGPDVITFALGSTPKTIQIASGELSLYPGTTIRGPGSDLLTVRGTNQNGYGVFFSLLQPGVANDPIEISGLSITNGASYGIGVVGAMTARVSDCLISGNNACGIYNSGGQLTVLRTTISGNTSLGLGGGIYSMGPSVSIDSCTISGNTAGSQGGGLYLALGHGSATISNSTIAGNSASGQGGGIWIGGVGASLIMNGSTIANNSGGSAGGVFNNAANLILSNTIVAKNTGGDLGASGTATSTATFSFIGDTQGDPLLGPLADNGGPTQTMALLPGSPCLDAGDPAFVPPPDTDQRGAGFARVSGAHIDIGAFERDTIAPSGSATPFNPATAYHSIAFDFSEDVSSSLSTDDFTLFNRTTAELVPTSKLALSFDRITRKATLTFPGFAGGILPNADYRCTLSPEGVSDPSGNPLQNSVVQDFFVLAGDLDRDRQVGFSDLVAVAQNYGQQRTTWTQGDLNGDGMTDFADLVTIAQAYGSSLPVGGQAVGVLAASMPAAPVKKVSKPLRIKAVAKPVVRATVVSQYIPAGHF